LCEWVARDPLRRVERHHHQRRLQLSFSDLGVLGGLRERIFRIQNVTATAEVAAASEISIKGRSIRRLGPVSSTYQVRGDGFFFVSPAHAGAQIEAVLARESSGFRRSLAKHAKDAKQTRFQYSDSGLPHLAALARKSSGVGPQPSNSCPRLPTPVSLLSATGIARCRASRWSLPRRSRTVPRSLACCSRPLEASRPRELL
jgi:hypothetical protein